MNIKIPVSWLRDYLKTDSAAKTIAGMLTAHGPSVDHMTKKGEDYLLDVEVTTNRPDANSVFGLARETYAILTSNGQNAKLIEPNGTNLKLSPDTPKTVPLDVQIKDSSLCERFTALVVDNVKIAPSPALVQNRLSACGIRPINNIVDISNYIMLESGQPMHMFDYDKILGAKMVLRASVEGEKIKTLDGKAQKIPAGSIVIEDAKRLIDLCGVMGGENSQITKRTKRVVLFVQSYNSQRIRKTTQELAVRTEASSRFEKGVDAKVLPQVLARATYLAKKLAGAKIASELVDIYYNNKNKDKTISLSFSKLNDYLGFEIDSEKARAILISLGFEVKKESLQIVTSPPSWREKDVESDVDLIEEIARLYGYHNLPSTLPLGQIPQSQDDTFEQIIELKKALKFLGLTEVITYSIISKNFISLMEIDAKNTVELINPLTEDWQFMRPSMVPSLAAVIAQNQNLKKGQKIFEIAKTYEKRSKGLPQQDTKIAIASESDFYTIKGIVENLFQILKREPKFEKYSGKNPLCTNSQFALINVGDTTVGGVGALNKKVADFFGLKGEVCVAEINLNIVYSQAPIPATYHPIPKYPPVIEDISAIFPKAVALEDITSQIKEIGKPLVAKAEVIDVYEDEKIGKDKRSVAVTITYQKSSATPTAEEVTTAKEKISENLTKEFRAIIRK